MLQLVLTILALGLVSMAVTAMVSAVNPSAVLAAQQAKRFENGFSSLQAGYQTYVLTTSLQPSSLADLTPAYVFVPPAPPGTVWSFGLAPSGYHYVCLSGALNPTNLQALAALSNDFSPQAYFLSSACGTAQAGATSAAYLLVRQDPPPPPAAPAPAPAPAAPAAAPAAAPTPAPAPADAPAGA